MAGDELPVRAFLGIDSLNSLATTLTRTRRVGTSECGCSALNHRGALLVIFFGGSLHAHLSARGTTVGLNVGIVILSIGTKT